MADITMCGDSLCPSAYLCKRNAVSGTVLGYWQVMSDFKRPEGMKQCDDYLPYKTNSTGE